MNNKIRKKTNRLGFRTTDKYVLFWGSIFSQWQKVDFTDINGTKFSSAEQFMFYYKARIFNDQVNLKKIMGTRDPKKQKAYGREVKNFKKSVWEKHARQIVFLANFYKFSQNPNMKEKLLSFKGLDFVEASPHDSIWGIGLHYENKLAEDKENWNGMNFLGEAINSVRNIIYSELKEEEKDSQNIIINLTKEIEDYIKQQEKFVNKKFSKNLKYCVN